MGVLIVTSSWVSWKAYIKSIILLYDDHYSHFINLPKVIELVCGHIEIQ